jgi:microcystin-dependent protein
MANLQDITNRSEVGTIKPWGKAAAPAGYLLCDGSAVSRTTYADLFAVLSTTYGVGNGSTTFNVPNLAGKYPQGKDGSNNLAGTGGANTVTVSVTDNKGVANNQAVTVTGSIANTSLTTAQLASHSHTGGRGSGNSQAGSDNSNISTSSSANTGSAGSGTAHNHSHTLTGSLTGNVALTGNVTASGTNSFSPFVVFQYIIKH